MERRPPPENWLRPGPAPRVLEAEYPKDLSDEDRARLVEIMAAFFSPDENLRAAAAVDLVDLGAPGARAMAQVLKDGDLSDHRGATFALFHAWADFVSLGLPADLDLELVEAALACLERIFDNREGAAWMAADALAVHGRAAECPEASRERIQTGFVRLSKSPDPGIVVPAIYGLAMLRDPTCLERLRELASTRLSRKVKDYLAGCLARAERDEDPEVPEVPEAPGAPG